MRVRGVYGERDGSTRFRVSKNGDSWEEILGEDKGGIEILCPQERFARTFQGVCERSKDLRCVSEKSPVEINHTKLGERSESIGKEMVSKELSLRQSKLALAQANGQAMGVHSSRTSRRC